jgi:hypothetical protein
MKPPRRSQFFVTSRHVLNRCVAPGRTSGQLGTTGYRTHKLRSKQSRIPDGYTKTSRLPSWKNPSLTTSSYTAATGKPADLKYLKDATAYIEAPSPDPSEGDEVASDGGNVNEVLGTAVVLHLTRSITPTAAEDGARIKVEDEDDIAPRMWRRWSATDCSRCLARPQNNGRTNPVTKEARLAGIATPTEGFRASFLKRKIETNSDVHNGTKRQKQE